MIRYLSPTSIMDWERCPERFNLVRLQDNWPAREPALARDTGTVFDAYVKCYLNQMLDFEGLLKGEIEADNQALEVGHTLFLAYKESGALAYLEEEGVAMVELDIKRILGGVPIRGKPDIILSDSTVCDWKVNGVGSPRGVSPKPGYSRRIDYSLSTGMAQEKIPHKRQNDYLEDINHPWAVQLCIYSFLIGKKPGNELMGGIEQLAIRGAKLAITSYRNKISKEFQEDLYDKFVDIWDKIQKGWIPIPTPSKFKCHKYGRICEVAHLCKGYLNEDTSAW